MYQSIRSSTARLIAKDAEFTSTHPVLYPFVKMTLLFFAIQVFVQMMYQISGVGSDQETLQEPNIGHPANIIAPLFPTDHAPLHIINSGSLSTLQKLINSADVAMVMSYAPWCHHSAKLAKAFLSLAKNQPEVVFVAIDCWNPLGECRRVEGASFFPRITLHRKHLIGKIDYYGHKNYQAMLHYSHRAVRPLTYLTSIHQFSQLLGLHEVLIVGYFNFTGTLIPNGYQNYYLASLLALQINSFSHMYANKYMTMVTNSTLAMEMSLKDTSRVYLIALHRGVSESISANTAPEAIYKWVADVCKKHKLIKEFVPSGNISYIFATPISLLFLPLPNMEEHILSSLLFKYSESAFINSKSQYSCSALNHLNYNPDPAHFHRTCLPLCSSDSKLLCPKYSPFFHLTSSNWVNSSFCQDDVGVVTRGWPPPCSHVRTSFRYIDSTKYWALAEKMGVSKSLAENGTFLIFVDVKNERQFFFPISNYTLPQFDEMFERIILGTANSLIKSGCGHSNCSTGEITARQLLSLIDTPKQVSCVLVAHFVSWCAVCTQLWPVLHSVSATYSDNEALEVLRINGDHNDLPKYHTPQYYPSLALYPPGSSMPIWFPVDQEISYENVIEFLRPHLRIGNNRTSDEVKPSKEDPSKVGGDQWEGLGWELWEISEKQRRVLEERNIRLGGEVGALKEKIVQLEQKSKDKVTLENVNLESIIEEVTRLMGGAGAKGSGQENEDPWTSDSDNRHDTHFINDHSSSQNSETNCEGSNDDTCQLS